MKAISAITTRRLTPALGATVSGIDGLDLVDAGRIDQLAAELHHALMEHQVLFLRDCNLTPQQHADVARSLGPLAPRHPIYPTHPDCDDVGVLVWGGPDGLTPDAAEWHTDMLFRPEPPFSSLLQAIEVPAVGGDTLWASMYAVYDSLGPGLQSELAELMVINDPGVFLSTEYQKGGTAAMLTAAQRAGSAVHPAIAHHPHTGRPYLNVAESTSRFVVGMSAAESNRLLTMLFDLINRPDFQVRLKWEAGTMAIWDNRATQHYAVADYLPNRRVMHRVVVARDARTATDTAVG